jgi:hypothetical protein
VFVDLPRFLVAPLRRRAHRTWGATAAEVGQWLAMVPRPSERTAFVVDGFAEPSWLLWRTPTRSWAWRLIPLGEGRTRLISRLYTRYEWRRPLTRSPCC